MIDSYKRIISGKYHDLNYELYKKEFYLEIKEFLIEREYYEECEILNKIINYRFNHKLNYTL